MGLIFSARTIRNKTEFDRVRTPSFGALERGQRRPPPLRRPERSHSFPQNHDRFARFNSNTSGPPSRTGPSGLYTMSTKTSEMQFRLSAVLAVLVRGVQLHVHPLAPWPTPAQKPTGAGLGLSAYLNLCHPDPAILLSPRHPEYRAASLAH